MLPRRSFAFPVLAVLVLASSGCPAEDGDGSGETHDSDPGSGSSGGHESSGDHGSEVDHGTGDPTPTGGHDDASTGHAHDSTGPAEDSGSTGRADDGGSTSAGSESGGDTGSAALAQEWCDCMITACHDVYHRVFGNQHPDSEENCLAAGGAVPVNGSPTQSGDFIECRIHFCEEANADESACESAIGGGMCM